MLSAASPPATLSAVRGWSVISLEMASEARPLAAASRNLPSSMKQMSVDEVSKHVLSVPNCPWERTERVRKKSEYK